MMKAHLVCGGFGYGNKVKLAFTSGRNKSIDYQEILETILLQFAEADSGLS